MQVSQRPVDTRCSIVYMCAWVNVPLNPATLIFLVALNRVSRRPEYGMEASSCLEDRRQVLHVQMAEAAAGSGR
jgi:hypothetical protein